MSRRVHHVIALVGGLGLLVLHLDFWRPQRLVLYGQWLPEELAYRVAWMVLAFVYLCHFCTWVWSGEDR